ncbi:MAG: histidine kinase [Pleurocapsa sp. MO_226.B13]|nr:histidine kinase [Pleurocapsa sp. MO_226.B13]
MLQSNEQYPNSRQDNTEEVLLQLLLFIDERSSSKEQAQQVQNYLKELQSDYSFNLNVIEIEKQPYLVEYLKLVVTPALVKISPAPKQTLAGSNLIQQLKKWWPQWQIAQEELKNNGSNEKYITSIDREADKAEKIKLADEIFCLKQEKQELAAQLLFKERILAMLAHDLRTPLTAASMAVETIKLSEQNDKLDPDKLKILKQKLFQQAKSQFGIMERMIGDLLQNSRNMNSKLQLKPCPLSLQSLCREVIAQFDSRLQQKSMTFEEDIPQDIPKVYADEKLIRQLISNLIDNAIKYTPKQGKISLSILHRTNQKVQVSVCDTGPGIPPEKRARIFEDSYRLQRDRSREGYGLGLATCQQIVCAHYGQIWVDSSPEEGSCFKFTLLVYK